MIYSLDRFESALVQLAQRFPRLAFILAGVYGAYRYGRKFPESLEAAGRKAVWVRLTRSNDLRRLGRLRLWRCVQLQQRRVLEHILSSGRYDSLLPLVQWIHPEHILDPLNVGKGVLAVTWHTGPFAALGIGLTKLHRSVSFLLSWDVEMDPDKELELFKISEGRGGSLAFTKCVSRLRGGGVVAMTGDSYSRDRNSIEVGLLDSTARLGRGIAALSRVGRARIVPVDIRWSRTGGLIYTAHPPLSSTLGSADEADSYERKVMLEFAAVLDPYLRQQIGNADSTVIEALDYYASREEKRRRRKARKQGMSMNGDEVRSSEDGASK